MRPFSFTPPFDRVPLRPREQRVVACAFVAWSNGSGGGDAGQYALEVATGRLWRLGEAPGYSLIYTAGDYVAWSKLGAEPQKPEQNAFVVARWRSAAPRRGR